MKIEKVLIVDDDEDIRIVTELAIRKLGSWGVATAASGREALAMVHDEKPDLILLDAMMPAPDGLETLEMLQGDPATARIPVIFLTAKVQSHEVEIYLARGARGVIRKPFDATTLPAEIRRILRHD